MKVTLKCLTLCAFLLLCFSLQAQFKFGVKGGAQLSTVYTYTTNYSSNFKGHYTRSGYQTGF